MSDPVTVSQNILFYWVCFYLSKVKLSFGLWSIRTVLIIDHLLFTRSDSGTLCSLVLSYHHVSVCGRSLSCKAAQCEQRWHAMLRLTHTSCPQRKKQPVLLLLLPPEAGCHGHHLLKPTEGDRLKEQTDQ
ncbi:hypothetical protein XENOCAPTIV_023877 [Xenoophorus captivus]|uniref:Uncharacterized protein n=1 Tax=Xenoophorus captivus TaxID=1517983 RepID=A0ABV0QXP8_9TELE